VATSALTLDEIDAFYGDSHVLHRVSFALGEGRLLGLLGRNGAGKSTSMNVTVGLLQPRRGAVSVYGRAVTGRTPEAIAALGVALVPQGRRVFRSLTVRENLAVAGRKPQGGLPMLVIDAWEHAYYLQYHTDKAKFFNALWNIWDWDDVAARFDRLRRVDLAIRDAADRATQNQQMQH